MCIGEIKSDANDEGYVKAMERGCSSYSRGKKAKKKGKEKE